MWHVRNFIKNKGIAWKHVLFIFNWRCTYFYSFFSYFLPFIFFIYLRCYLTVGLVNLGKNQQQQDKQHVLKYQTPYSWLTNSTNSSKLPTLIASTQLLPAQTITLRHGLLFRIKVLPEEYFSYRITDKKVQKWNESGEGKQQLRKQKC